MKVIILAAGKGERLYPLTRNTPKSLVHIGNGMTILETQLNAISDAGVSDVVIVGGYRVEQIEAKIKTYVQDLKLNIDVVFNPFFNVSNNLVSLWFAKHAMKDGFVIVNGDDIFKTKVLGGLLEEPDHKDICAVVSTKDEYDTDDMKVRREGDHLTQISKKIPLEEAAGESIGMIRVLGKATNAVANQLESMVRDPDSLNVFWLEAFNGLIRKNWEVWTHEIRPADWAEMDFHPDVEVVRDRLNASLDKLAPDT